MQLRQPRKSSEPFTGPTGGSLLSDLPFSSSSPPLLPVSARAVSFSRRGLAKSKPLDSKEREKERKTIFVYFPLKKLFFDKDRSLVSSYTIRKRAEENVTSFSGRKHWPHAFQKKRISISHRGFKIFFRYRAIAIHVQFFY